MEDIFKKYVSHMLNESHSKQALDNFIEYYELNFGRHLPTASDPILEIGSGMGEFLYFLQKKGYTNVRAVELSPESVHVSSKIVNYPVHQIKDLVTYLTEHRDEFAAIIMNDVLEHIPKNNILKTLDYIHNSLKKDGSLLLTVPNASCSVAVDYRFSDFTHEISFTERSLRQILLASDFTNINIFPQKFYKINKIRRFLRTSARHFLHFIIKIVYYIEAAPVPKVLTTRLLAVAKK